VVWSLDFFVWLDTRAFCRQSIGQLV
jgi:hypothetical protein